MMYQMFDIAKTNPQEYSKLFLEFGKLMKDVKKEILETQRKEKEMFDERVEKLHLFMPDLTKDYIISFLKENEFMDDNQVIELLLLE